MSDLPPTDFNQLNKDQIIALLKQIAQNFGRVPTYLEFRRITKAGQRRIKRLFGGFRECLQQAGFAALGPGYELTADELLADWAAVARKLGRIPTVLEYKQNGKYSDGAFARRWKSWHDLPAALLRFAERKRLQSKWHDVIKLARKHIRDPRAIRTRSPRQTPALPISPAACPPKTPGPSYGHPIMMQELATAPINEAGVLFLFGALAKALGFMVLRVQSEFPDVEALRCGDNDRWRRVRIELEFESKNFLLHGHHPRECDLIVCWSHNWPSCPVEVLELSRVVLST